jgi:ankyrin repeat protein
LLLEKGAQPDIKDKDGRTALSWAIEGGDPVIIQLLVSQTAEVDYFYTLVSESESNWMDLC